MHDVIEDSTHIEIIKAYFVYYIWVKPTFGQKVTQWTYTDLIWILAEIGLHSDMIHEMVFNMSNEKSGQIISTIKYTRLFVSSYYIF